MKFSVFANNPDNRMVCALSQLTDKTRWESGQRAGERSGIQKDLKRSRDPAQSSTSLGTSSSQSGGQARADWGESSSAGKDAEGSAGQRVEQEPAARPGSEAGQPHPELYWDGGSWSCTGKLGCISPAWVPGRDCCLLFNTGESGQRHPPSGPQYQTVRLK